MDDSRIKTAAELISALISPQTASAAGNWASVVSVWPSLVGERPSAHSCIVDLTNGFILVEADHPGWIQTLQFRQSELLEGLQKRFPSLGIRGIQYRLRQKGALPSVSEKPSGAEESEASSLPEEETAREPLPVFDPESIQDEALKKALLGLRDAMEEE